MKIKGLLAFTALASALLAAPAAAATFSYNANDLALKTNDAGNFKAISATFDDKTEQLTWSSTFERNAGNNALAEGAWLVLSDGENPKKDSKERVIFYMDGVNNKVSAYEYNGQKGRSSWRASELLGTKSLDVKTAGNERKLSFNWDMSDINGLTGKGPDWKGATFGEEIGLWFHGVDSLETGYDAEGRLTGFDAANTLNSGFDPGRLETVVKGSTPSSPGPTPKSPAPNNPAPNNPKEVTEPGTAAALAVVAAAAVLATKQRRRSA